jgi:hypothetical protein
MDKIDKTMKTIYIAKLAEPTIYQKNARLMEIFVIRV